MTFNIEKSVNIQVIIESFTPYHHSCDRMQPDDPEEIEISARMTIQKGNKVYNIGLTDNQIKALGLEQDAIDYIKQDRESARIDRMLDREPVPDLLMERIGSVNQIRNFVKTAQNIMMEAAKK